MQKDRHVEIIEKIADDFRPEARPLPESDRILNATYQAVLGIQVHDGNRNPVTTDQIRSVQRLWIPYRDASAKLFNALNPSVELNTWKSWLTDTRTQQLQSILERDHNI